MIVDWQSMETAPKDGRFVWGGHWERGTHANDYPDSEIVWFEDGRWHCYLGEFLPDYWAPIEIPVPPRRDGSPHYGAVMP